MGQRRRDGEEYMRGRSLIFVAGAISMGLAQFLFKAADDRAKAGRSSPVTASSGDPVVLSG